MEKPIQETTSTYFNPILKKSVVPLPVEDINPQLVETFNKAVEEAFTQDAPIVKERIEYLIPYIIQNIDWDEYGNSQPKSGKDTGILRQNGTFH